MVSIQCYITSNTDLWFSHGNEKQGWCSGESTVTTHIFPGEGIGGFLLYHTEINLVGPPQKKSFVVFS